MTTPIRAHTLLEPHGCAGANGGPELTVKLDFEDRHRRRLMVTTEGGERVLIDLVDAVRLRDGDRLQLEDGRVLKISAHCEPVAEIAADPHTLVRLAWHLGNRHTPTAVLPGCLRIRRDHVLETMVTRLGGTVAFLEAPFDPEAGAYHDHHRHASYGHEREHKHHGVEGEQ